ncbi:MAG: gamma-glutamylcyclotransferase family protein [Nanoarchaeota archaeon]
MNKIFVYGTLLSGEGNWKYYLKDAKLLGEETLDGDFTMVSLGGFPGVIPTGKGVVKGEVYEVDDLTYQEIERLEGYHPDPKIAFYSKMKVDTKFGEAEMYILDEKSLDYPIIKTGDWKNH